MSHYYAIEYRIKGDTINKGGGKSRSSPLVQSRGQSLSSNLLMEKGDWFHSPKPASKANLEPVCWAANLFTPTPVKLLNQISQSEMSIGKTPKGNEESRIFARDMENMPKTKDETNVNLVKHGQNQVTLSPESLLKTRKKKYKIRSVEEKWKILMEAETIGLAKASKKHKVSINNVCRWKRRCERKVGAGRKVSDPDMEEEIIAWIKAQGQLLTRRAIRQQARKISGKPEFKASKGWFQRLILRHPIIKQYTNST